MEVAQEKLAKKIYRIAPSGRIDTYTVPDLESVIEAHLDAKRTRLIIDLAVVTYISSSGLRALLSAQRRARGARGDVVLCNMAPRIREIFEIVGFLSLFVVSASVKEATEAFATRMSKK